MTSHATKELVIESLHLKVQRFFEKPISAETLQLALEECLHENSGLHKTNQVEIAPGIHLNFQLQAVIQDDKEVQLTTTEFEILKTLWAHRNQKILRQEIIEKIWAQRNISSNNFDTQFSNLKKKVPALRDHLTVIRGKGYIYSST